MTNSIAVPPLDFTMPSTPREKRELTAKEADAIKATWLRIEQVDPLITSSALMRHLSTLAPRTRVLFCEMTGKDGAHLVELISELIKEATKPSVAAPSRTASFDSDSSSASTITDYAVNLERADENIDLSSFYCRVGALRHHFGAIAPENFPAMHRAVLFTIWEIVGDNYTDVVAKAFSTICHIAEEAIAPHMTAEERRRNHYFHRRAPGSIIGVESPEALAFAQAMS